jgi:ABC-type antimicrobial peptide transport system permease subunit
MTVIGGVVGVVVALGLGHYARSLLFELQEYDPIVVIAATIALALVALGAGYIPALRASRVDPMLALRYE